MSFFEARIAKDLEDISIPIKYTIEGKTMNFSIEISTDIYFGIYNFVLDFPEEYPFKSPKLKCMTPVFHPNIDEKGNVCLMILREGWVPAYDINSIVVSLICTFTYPSSEDALNTEAAQLLEQDYELFIERARRV